MRQNRLYLYIFLIMMVSFFGLRIINFVTRGAVLTINEKPFKVEMAKTRQELSQGLSGRKTLGKNHGMLFVFPHEDTYGFWMKGMNFPIDIIWINEGKIIDIKHRAPAPKTMAPETYFSREPARYVLEINAGLAEEYGFKIGDEVDLDI